MGQAKGFPVDELVRQVMEGTDPAVGGRQLRVDEYWHDRLQELADTAKLAGDSARSCQIQAIGALFGFSVSMEREHGGQHTGGIERILKLSRSCGSKPVHSWVVGQLGSTLGWPNGIELVEEALNIAHGAGLTWAVCQWAGNLAALWLEHDPEQAKHWATVSLHLARSIGDKGRVGIALNNLAVLCGRDTNSLEQARSFEMEALAIAQDVGDTRDVAERSAYLAEICEQLGRREEAIFLYSRALDGFRELKHRRTFDLIRHLATLITAPFEEGAKPILINHVKALDRPLNESDLSDLLRRTEKGQVMMAGWDPERQSVVFEPDLRFAKDLCERREWRALAVYARHWMEQGFAAGDSVGLHWLSISFRGLGLEDAAEASLEFGLRLHAFFEDRMGDPSGRA